MSCNPKQAHQMIQQNINNPKFKIIDVRSLAEYQGEHINGAQLIPLGELEQRLSELKKDDIHLIVCRSGARSGSATQILSSKGYKAINLSGGLSAWTSEKYPTTSQH